MSSIFATFIASVQSVGTAATLAFSGFYLHRKGMLNAESKKGLARFSQQVAIPALFFSKIVYCPQNLSSDKCPNVVDHLGDAWVLLVWPLYVVSCGLLVGHISSVIAKVPAHQRRNVLAATAFANSTGLPITLLTVVGTNMSHLSAVGPIDPNLFLSIYLILYPILQWGLGGWLVAGEEESHTDIENTKKPQGREGGVRHVLNMDHARREEQDQIVASHLIEELSLSSDMPSRNKSDGSLEEMESLSPGTVTTFSSCSDSSSPLSRAADVAPFTETMYRVLCHALQPPVVGAILGLVVSSIPPLRGAFVDVNDRDDDAILEWLFNGIYAIGQAAVPINMAVLGFNLSKAAQANTSKGAAVGSNTIAAVVIGKMVVMPLIGLLTGLILKEFIWNIPEGIQASFYLVLMIVFITPTANTVMIIVDLSESGAKEGMAKIIGYQFVVAPVILSLSVMAVVHVAAM